MARPWRIQFLDALYHVTSLGNNREDIFLEDDDRRLFLDTHATAISRSIGIGQAAFALSVK
jgi:hypothetical protein